jgi:hypothetical protein
VGTAIKPIPIVAAAADMVSLIIIFTSFPNMQPNPVKFLRDVVAVSSFLHKSAGARERGTSQACAVQRGRWARFTGLPELCRPPFLLRRTTGCAMQRPPRAPKQTGVDLMEAAAAILHFGPPRASRMKSRIPAIEKDSRERREVSMPGRSVNCSAPEKARVRIIKVATSPAMPDAARIMATMMNWKMPA